MTTTTARTRPRKFSKNLASCAVSFCFYFLLSTFYLLGAADAADEPFADRPGRISVRITNPTLAALTGLASVRMNLGDLCRPDGADLLVLDSRGREQPSLVRSITPAGEIELVFQVRGDPVGPYQVLFGKSDAQPRDYKVKWNLGRVVIDDSLPAQTRNHGLWEWTGKVKLSGAFSHTTPVTGGMTYHGTTRLPGVVAERGGVLNQYVYLDGDQPPSQVLVRLVFEGRKRSNPWDFNLKTIDCNWGAATVRPGKQERTNQLGDCPPTGQWVKLTMNLDELMRRANIPGYDRAVAKLPPLHGIEFYTDRGRVFWDMTTLSDVPAPSEVVGILRSPSQPAFVWSTLHHLRLKDAEHPLNLVKFIPPAGRDEPLLWDFGDGTTSSEFSPEHVFTGTDAVEVTLKLTGDETAAVTRKLTGLDVPTRPVRFAADLVSCPKVVCADSEVLFNLRLEGTCKKILPATLVLTDLDADGNVLAEQARPVELPPGPGHPINVTFTRKLSHPGLRRLRMDLMLKGHRLAGTTLSVHDAAGPLGSIRLVGDVYQDGSGQTAVVRYGSTRTPLVGKVPGALRRVLLVGDVPVAGQSFGSRLEEGLLLHPSSADVKVAAWKVPAFPAWSLPWRATLALAGGSEHLSQTNPPDLIVVALADGLLLAGVSADDAANVIGVVLEQLRRRTDADVILLTPFPYPAHQRQARDTTIALKKLALVRQVRVADFYSRAARRMKENPGLYRDTQVIDGIRAQRVPDALLDELLDVLADEVTGSPGR